ncbi:MAG: ECF-type sigma factor [Planctomycetota bacterium]
MTEAPDHLATRLANAAAGGDGEAAEKLLPLVYEELRTLAHQRMAGEAPGTTLQPTALVHEAYLRLFEAQPSGWAGRAHFFGAAAEAMRRILVERARQRRSLKRGGGRRKIDFDLVSAASEPEPDDLLALDEADRAGRIVKLRCFAGMTVDEVGEALAISPRTVHREWDAAKAWLRVEVHKGDTDAG